jgi:ATP-dependent DNA helicase RecG
MHLGQMLQKGPGPQTEFMLEPDADRLAETLVAFANADGGTIVIGMARDGTVADRLLADDMEGALRLALTACRPPVRTEWEQIDTPEGVAVAIHVPRSAELHALADGRVLLRSGADNRPLGGEMIRQLAATKSTGDFETEMVAGATEDDLDPDVIAEYITKREERLQRAIDKPARSLLQMIGALDQSGDPTVLGLLLFGRDPQSYLTQSGLLFVRFSGSQPRGPGGLPGYGRREEIGGPLARLLERSWQVLWEEMRVEAVVRGLQREERTEYPPFAVREALVNAVAHRDYRLRGRRIEVRMFDDRLEVHSPGGLPGHITLDNIVEEHYSRNPRLVSGLFQWGYIEELGLGIDRMIEDMVRAGHPPPTFRATPYSFAVVLQNVLERQITAQWDAPMNERQARALQFLQEHGRITNREYRDLCSGVSGETARLDLTDLVDRGILMRIGEKRGTFYILK